MTPETTSYLRFELEGAEQLDFSVFAHTAVDLDKLLRHTTTKRAGMDAHWRTAPVIHVAASPNGVSAAALEGVVTDAFAAVAATASGDPRDWPEDLDSKQREITRRMVRRLRRAAPVLVEASNSERIVIPQTEAFGRTMRPVFAAWSTVEGRLRSIADYPSPQFVIYESGTDNPVHCAITPGQYEEAFRNFLGAVRVHGYVYYRATGRASSVRDVALIETLRPPERELTEFRGAIPRLTHGVSPGEYIRRLRAGGDE